MRLILEEDAISDLENAFQFYEDQEPGAGRHFFDSIQPEIRSLLNTAGVHRKRCGFHFYASKRFPHGIYYLVDHECLRVVAVVDCRMNPKTIRRILRSR